MATTFAYKVREKNGKLVSGSVEGESLAQAVARLRQKGLVPVEITNQGEAKAGGAGGKKGLKMSIGGKIKLKDVAVFSRQFSTMINSGLSLLRSLTILSDQTASKKLAETVALVSADIETGAALSASLAKHPKAFSRLYVAMIRAGEAGGILDQVLLRLADTLEGSVHLRQKIKSAMTYPVVVMCMVLMIVAAMLLFVVPMFEALYKDLGGQLPLPTRVLIAISNAVKGFWYLVFGSIIGLGFGLRRYIATDKGRYVFDAFKLKAPVFGGLVHKVALARFARTLSVLMRSGVPILQCLEIVSETAGNEVVSRAVLDVQESVKEGEAIAKPLANHKIFPPMVVQMMAVGEETGALDSMLAKIADFYEQEVEAIVEALTSLIEPILIAVMGASVGGMVVALYLPMFNIINLVK